MSNALAQREQTVSNASPKAYAEPLAGVSSSSSSLISEDLKTTTTGEPELLKIEGVSLSPEWQAVDIASLSEIGFSQAHLIQLARQGKFSAAEVQESIQYFAFDLKRNGFKSNGPAINFFMGILRKGNPYAPPANYESPADEARRKYLEAKRRIEERRLAEEREVQELEFGEWMRGLTHEQVDAIVPEVVRHIRRLREESLRTHFVNEIWPEKSATIQGLAEQRATIKREIEQSLAGEGA